MADEKKFATPEQMAAAKESLEAAETKEQVVEAWRKHYLEVGHKRLGRMLIGKDPELKKNG